MSLPDYVPTMIWVGVTNGLGPKVPMVSTSEETIRKWAAEDPGFRIIFSVGVPEGVELYRVEKVPETTKLVQVNGNETEVPAP